MHIDYNDEDELDIGEEKEKTEKKEENEERKDNYEGKYIGKFLSYKKKMLPWLMIELMQLNVIKKLKFKTCLCDFLGHQVTKTLRSQCRQPRFNSWSGMKSYS